MESLKPNINKLLEDICYNDSRKSFERLFNIYYQWLLTVAVSLLRRRTIAEEAVGDSFFKVWQNRKELSKINNIETYLYVLVRNKCYDILGSSYEKQRSTLEDASGDLTYTTPESIYINNELKELLDTLVDQLPGKCRKTYQLVRLKGYSYREAADELKVTKKTVENQLNIAVKKLREGLLQQYYNENDLPDSEVNTRKLFFILLLLSTI